MSEKNVNTAAFVLSLIGGLLILLGGAFGSMIGMFGFSGMMGGFQGMGGMMGGMGGMMGGGFAPGGTWFGLMMGLGVLGVVSGVIVLVSALMLNSRPNERMTWGTLILAFSIVALFSGSMGGFGLGSILGIVGGILAITWKPS
jgi:hypothetical protein